MQTIPTTPTAETETAATVWRKDPKHPGIRLHVPSGHWCLNQRVGRTVLTERTPFRENQRTLAKHFRDERVQAERERQKKVGLDGGVRLTLWNEVVNVYLHRLQNNPALSEKTKVTRGFRLRSIFTSWFDLYGTDLRETRVDATNEDLLIGWHGAFAKLYSPTYTNKVKAIWSALYDIAIQQARVPRNAANLLPGLSVTQKQVLLPTRADFAKLLETIGNQPRNKWAKATRDFVEGLVYTGLRHEEAGLLRVEHVKFTEDGTRGWLSLPAEVVKNRQRARVVPIQPAAVELFKRLVKDADPQTGEIFAVKRCRGTLTRACKTVGIHRLTHHSLRHLFATLAYEGTGNAPLVAQWLGHGDGGALVHKTYNHVRDEFAAEQGAKLNFGLKAAS